MHNITSVVSWPAENSPDYFTDFKGHDFVAGVSNGIKKN